MKETCFGCYKYASPKHCDTFLPPSTSRCANAGPCHAVWDEHTQQIQAECRALAFEENRHLDPWVKEWASTAQNEPGQDCVKEVWKTCLWKLKCRCLPDANNIIKCASSDVIIGESKTPEAQVFGEHCTGRAIEN